jgi:hypothetical protein
MVESSKRAARRGQPPAGRAEALRRQVAELQRKIDAGMGRMALIDEDMLKDHAATVRG